MGDSIYDDVPVMGPRTTGVDQKVNNLREFLLVFRASISGAMNKPATKGDILNLAEMIERELRRLEFKIPDWDES